MATTGDQMERIGSGLTKGVTVPILGLGVAALKSAIDFESAFAGVRKTVNATELQFKELEKGITDMSMRLPASTTEIARVAEAAGQLGIQRESILGFTETMIRLGTSTNLSSTEAATALARLANITQLPEEQFSNLGSAVVALGNNLATTEAEIIEMSLRIASAGKTVGLTQAQILGFAGALSSVGIEAEAGGSAISRVMIEIKNQVASAGDNLQTFAAVAGMSADQFSEAFNRDAAGAIITFIEGLARMQRAGENVFPVLDELGLADIRVRNALLAAANAGDLFRSSLDLGTKAFAENTALSKESEQRYQTMASQLKLIRNQLSGVAIALGQGLVPALKSALDNVRPLLDALKEGAQRFADLDKSTQDNIVKIGLFAASVGPAILLATRLSKAVVALSAGLAAAKFATLAVAGGAAKLGEALLFVVGKTNLIALGITALVAAGYYLVKNWEHIKTKALNEWGLIKVSVLKNNAAMMESFATMIQFFNKEGAENLRQRAAQLREQSAAEQSLVDQRKQMAQSLKEQDQRLADDRANYTEDVLKRMEQAEEETAKARAKAAQDAADAQRQAEEEKQSAMAASLAAAEKMAKQQQYALDVLSYKVQQVDDKWSLFTATQGKATQGAEQTAAQQTFLRERLDALHSALAEVTKQYENSKSASGEFSEETMRLGGLLSQTKQEIASTRAELQEISGPIAEAKDQLTAAGKAVTEMKGFIETLSGRLQTAKDRLEETNKAIKALEDSSKDAKQGIADMLGVMADRIKDVEAQMKDLEGSTKSSQQAIADAFGVMTSRAGDLERQIDDARNAMKDLANVRLAGEGALDQELKDLERREALIKQSVNALRLSGVSEDDNRIKQLRLQLENIGLLKEGVQLRREIDFEPLREQLRRMVDDSKEMTFDQAKAAIEGYQKQVTDLTAKHVAMTQQIESLRSSVGVLVPSVARSSMTFDQAAASVNTHKASIDANNTALAALTTQHSTMTTEYEKVRKSVEDLLPKIGNASLSFEQAKTKIDEHKTTIENNKTKLDELYTAQASQQTVVDNGTQLLKDYNTQLDTLIQKEKDAASAVDALRSAAATAAAVLAGFQVRSSGGSGSGTSSPKPLRMAEGGVAKRPILFGEAGPEVFAPLPSIAGWMQSIGDRIGVQVANRVAAFSASLGEYTSYRGLGMSADGQVAMASAGNMTFHVNIGNRELYDLVIEAMQDGERRGRIKSGTTIS